VLQVFGAYLVHHFLRGDSVYGVFATVLGLLAWIYLAVEITVYAAETNVVLARQLWPRSIVQPPLTEADRAVLAAQARQNQRRDDQHVDVSFDDQPPDTGASGRPPRTPDEIAPQRWTANPRVPSARGARWPGLVDLNRPGPSGGAAVMRQKVTLIRRR